LLAGVHVTARADTTPGVEQRHNIPETIATRAAMAEPDYVDLFTVTAPRASDSSPEEWARVALEGASAAGRFLVWQVLCGLRLETEPSSGNVAGWRIADRGAGWVRLEAASWFITAHAVVRVEDDRVSIALFIRYDSPAGRFIWTPLSVAHRRLMPGLLIHAVRRMNRGRR
jgi:hypothetical protein